MSFVSSDRSLGQRTIVYGSAASPRTSTNGTHIRRDNNQERIVVDPLSLWNSPGQVKPSPSERKKFVISHAMTIEEAIEVSQEHTRVLQADIIKLQMELSESLMRMESASERADDAEAKVARLQVQVHECEWKMKAREGADLDQYQELKKLREQVMSLQTERHLIVTEKERLEVILENDSRQQREEMQSVYQEINRLTAKLSHTELSLSASTDDQVQLKMATESLRSENEAYRQQVAGLHDQLTKALKEKEAAVMIAKQANVDSEQSGRKEKELTKRLAAVEQDRDQLREFGDELATTLQLSSSKKDQFSTENKALRDEVAALKAQLVKLSSDMAMMRVSVDQAEGELQRVQKAHELEMADRDESSTRKIQKVKAENAQRAARHETLSNALDATSRDLATTKVLLDRATEHKHVVLSRAVARMKNLSLYKAWNNWRSAANEEKRLRASSSKIVFRWMTRDVSRAFNSWLAQHQEAKRLLATKNKILHKWIMKDALGAFNAWLEQHQEARRLQAAKGKIVNRWRMKDASKALNTWVANHQERSRRGKVTARVVARWQGKDTLRAFNSWAQQHREARDRGRKLRGALGRWSSRGLAAGWGRWVEATREAARLRLKTLRCVSLWGNRSRARALLAWRDNAARPAGMRAASRQVVLRMRNRGLCLAFLALADGAARQKESRAKTRKIVLRWTQLAAASAFEAWRGASSERRRMRALTQRALARWTQPVLSRVFNAWSSVPTAAQRMAIVVGRWMNSGLLGAFRTWAETVTLETAATKHFERAARRWANIWLGKAVSRWADFVEDQRWEDQVKYRVLTRMMHVKTAMAFATWRMRAGETAEEMMSWRWALRRSDKKTRGWAWRAWVDNKEEAMLLLESLDAPAGQRTHLGAEKGLVGVVAGWALAQADEPEVAPEQAPMEVSVRPAAVVAREDDRTIALM